MHQLLDAGEFTRTELAAALNVASATVDDWVDGTVKPDRDQLARLERAAAADEVAGAAIDVGLRRGPVRVPLLLWEPAFAPRGRFRLPLNLEWSGTGETRWRNAADLDSLLVAYTIVMVEGRYADIVRWIDPRVVADHVDEIIWPRQYEQVWRVELTKWGLL
ncbi:hypothetical protein HWD35_24575 [Tsukamurella tyrosinosolvens]|uniref:hypothetical protein n=1 Tax=Tsukamurella TaxID=2060 RepID=UPI000E08D850|nr:MULTISPECIES: hypothetical protein [Tsukamurella]MCA4997898.1 hypothetical protein [Tsukamurella tyrosinosolvens]RDH13571.1 hypothetical protein DVB88_01610 [Tsukamurella pulmonis]